MSVFVISWPLPGDASSSSALQRLKAGDVDNNNSVVIYVVAVGSSHLNSVNLYFYFWSDNKISETW